MLKQSRDELFESGVVGDCWAFDGEYIFLILPVEDEDHRYAALRINSSERPSWNWNGNREAPTLTPSILHHSTPPWHGYLTDGKMVEA